jgi:hypothetical protein
VTITVPFHLVTITGTLFRDLNDDHVQEGNEAGLSGWTVQLDGTTTALTNSAGQYAFSNVGPGTHTIGEVVQSAYIETSPRGNLYSFDTSNGLNVSGKNFSNEIPTTTRDNGQRSYSVTGRGWTTINSGWNGNSQTHTPDSTGRTFATWQLNAGATIPPGRYEVFVTFVTATGRATNAPYKLVDNTTTIATIAVDQTRTPGDGLYQGVRWRSLGAYTFSSGKPSIILSANANGVVDADGVLLIPASAFNPATSTLLAAAASSSTSNGDNPSATLAASAPASTTGDTSLRGASLNPLKVDVDTLARHLLSAGLLPSQKGVVAGPSPVSRHKTEADTGLDAASLDQFFNML